MRHYAIVCDRCRKEQKVDSQPKGAFDPPDTLTFKVTFLSVVIGTTYTGDLCPECIEDFKRWMKKS